MTWLIGFGGVWDEKTHGSIKSLVVALDEMSATETDGALTGATGVEESIYVNTIGRKLRPGVATSLQHLIKIFDVPTITWKTARHANDGNGLDRILVLVVGDGRLHL